MWLWIRNCSPLILAVLIVSAMALLHDYMYRRTQNSICEDAKDVHGVEIKTSSRGECFIKTEDGWVTRLEFEKKGSVK